MMDGGAVAHAMNHDLVLGRAVENQAWIRRGIYSPQAAFVGKLIRTGMLQ
jgi:hypothetical protein